MSLAQKPRLISFDLCPFVQRSVITLLEKHIDFDIRFIDLENPPQWFLDISPFGKVPVLEVGDTVLFESAVINEYLDEVTPPSLHPSDPLIKALNKAWIEFASELITSQYLLSVAKDEDHFDQQRHTILQQCQRLEAKLDQGPFFNGEKFCLIDAAFAPAFIRFKLLDQRHSLELYTACPKLKAWAETLVARKSVIDSLPQNFERNYFAYIKNTAGYAASRFTPDSQPR